MLRLMQPLLEGLNKTRFPDAGLSREEDRLALAGLCQLPAFEEHADLAGAANEFRQLAGVRGFEAAFHLAFAADREQGNG